MKKAYNAPAFESVELTGAFCAEVDVSNMWGNMDLEQDDD